MSDDTISFVETLVQRFPSLVEILNEHKEDNFGEILPHVFLWDVTNYVVALAVAIDASTESTTSELLRSILDFFESCFKDGSDDTRELISVSFLEHIPRYDDPGSVIRKMVGPNLAKQLDIIG